MENNAPKFDVKKPFDLLSEGVSIQEKAPKFSEDAPFREIDTTPEAAFNILERGGQALDIPASVVRSGVDSAIKSPTTLNPLSGFAEGAASQIKNIADEGLDATLIPPQWDKLVGDMGVENPTAQKVLGFGASVLTDPMQLLPVSKMVSPIKRVLKGKASNQAAKVIQRYTPPTKFLSEGIDPDKLGRFLVEEDMIKDISNPVGLYKKISGDSLVETTSLAKGLTSIKSKKISSGIIGDISDDLASHIKTVSPSAKPIDGSLLEFRVNLDRVKNMYEKTSGIPINPAELDDAASLLSNIVQKDPSILGKTQYNLEELYQLKKNINKQLQSPLFFAPADKSIDLTKQVLIDTSAEADNLIKASLKGKQIKTRHGVLDAGDYYATQNNRLHHLLQLKSILKSTPLKELKSMDLGQIVAELGGASAIGAFAGGFGEAGSAAGGALTGMAIAGLRRSGQIARETAPEVMSKAYNFGANNVDVAARFIPEMGRQIQNPKKAPYIGRQPQSEPDMEYVTIPRTTKGILKYKDLIIEKAYNELPESEAYGIMETLNKMPEKIPDILPALSMLFPEKFDKDRYDRIDGKVPPNLREKARRDIMLDKSVNSYQKKEKLRVLNTTGELYDNMEEY